MTGILKTAATTTTKTTTTTASTFLMDNFDVDDDELTLLHLNKPPSNTTNNDNNNNNNNFEKLSLRFINDITSTFCIKSHASFWNNLHSSIVNSFGFTSYHYVDSTTTATTTTTASDHNNSSNNVIDGVDLNSHYGKLHLNAVTSLLGVSMENAKHLTLQVLQLLSQQQKQQQQQQQQKQQQQSNNDKNKNNNDNIQRNNVSSLLGTQKLLQHVQEYHYKQQLVRIQFITQSLRHEQQQQQQENDHDTIKQSCKEFLDILDKRTTLSMNSDNNNNHHNDNALDRGLFKTLLCISCAPVQMLQRENVHSSFSLLSNDNDNHNYYDETHDKNNTSILYQQRIQQQKNDNDQGSSNMMKKSLQHAFTKKLMTSHEQHYGITLRAAALEALFMLLYTRIQGGITRGDYLMIVLAFDQQHFYLYPQTQKQQQQQQKQQNELYRDGMSVVMMKRCSELTALIMAECMSLWHATNNNHLEDDEWVTTHPFLIVNDKDGDVTTELKVIGNLLLEKFASQVLNRRNVTYLANTYDTNMDGMMNHSIEIIIDAPESIAILTFGLLLKMANVCSCSHRDSTNTASPSTMTLSNKSSWACDDSIKDLAMQCISVTNDECGVFDYLGNVMQNFLPNRHHFDYTRKNTVNTVVDVDEWSEYEFFRSMDVSARSNEELVVLKKSTTFQDLEEDEAIINYASIGREILVATLCAFRGSISISNMENVTMLCDFASKIYRNNVDMCSQFWSDWASQPETRSRAMMDPMCLLLDTVYQLADNAITEEITVKDDILDSALIDCTKFAATILPSIAPLLAFISSLIPSNGQNINQILQAFLSNGIIHAGLLGCLYLCSIEEIGFSAYNTNTDLLKSAASTMNSLTKIARFISHNDLESILFLQGALAPPTNNDVYQSWQGNGAQLLHKIALSAHQKLTHNKESSLRKDQFVDDYSYLSSITSCSLLTMASLLQCKENFDCAWLNQTMKCFLGENNRISYFSNSQSEEIIAASVQLLYRLSFNVMNLFMTDGQNYETTFSCLDVIDNNALAACEYLLLIDTRSKGSDKQYFVIIHSLRILQTLLIGLNDIALIHTSEKVRNRAKQSRDSIVQCLSSSAKIGKVISFYAANPITSGLLHTFNISDTDKRFSSIAIDSKEESKQLELCDASMSLLVSWMQIAEQIALDAINNFSSTTQVSLQSAIDTLVNNESLSLLSSTLDSIGPHRLLFSLAETPLEPSVAPNDPNNHIYDSVLSTIVKHIGVAFQCKKAYIYDVSMKVLDLMLLSLRHSRIIAMQSKSIIEIFHSKHAVQMIGLELHGSLKHLLRRSCELDESKRGVMLLKLLDILTCSISLHPFLSVTIISGQSGKALLVEELLATLKTIQHYDGVDKVVIATSCATVFCELWKVCCEQNGNLSSEPHPCSDLLREFFSSEAIFDHIIDIFSNDNIIGDYSDTANADLFKTYKQSNIARLFSCCIDIIAVELIVNMKNGKPLSDPINKCLGVIAQKGLLKLLFQSLSFDCLNTQAHCHDAFLESISIKKYPLSDSALSHTFQSIKALHRAHCNIQDRKHVEHLLRLNYESKLLVESQLRLMESIAVMGETLHAYNQVVNTNFPPIFVSFEEVEKLVTTFCTLTEKLSRYESSLAPNVFRSVCSQAIHFTQHFLGYLALSVSTIKTNDQSNTILCILDAMINPCQTLLDIMEFKPQAELRSSFTTVANLAIDALKKGEKLSFSDRNTFHTVRLKYLRFICHTLKLLDEYRKMSESGKIQGEDTMSTEVLESMLQTAVMFMTVLISNNDDDGILSSLTMQTYRAELFHTLRSCDAIPLLMAHVEFLSLSSIQTKLSAEDDPNFDVIKVFFDLFVAMTESPHFGLSTLFLENHFINFLMKNPLILSVNKMWIVDQTNSNFRGYAIKKQTDNVGVGLKQIHDKRKEDPMHYIWRSVLRIVTSLARSSNALSKGFMSPEECGRNTVAVIDFMQAYELSIEKLLICFEKAHLKSNESLGYYTGKENDVFGYSATVLNEAADILALVSEICSVGNVKIAEVKADRAIKRFASFSMQIVMSLSSFLGAIGTARELFSLLNVLNNMNEDEMSEMHQRLASHPLLADGVSQGKHEAIRHALLANNFCVRVTEEECLLSQMNVVASKDSELSQFETHVKNEYLFRMEKIAGRCIFNAISVLTKLHPAASSFVSFSRAEAESLQLACIPPKGTIVVVRDDACASNSILEHLHLNTHSFARVIGFNEFRRSLDVEYINIAGNALEQDVHLSRIAAIEDKSKRVTLFQYQSASDSIRNVTTSGKIEDGKIGHLIQILRWCQHHNSMNTIKEGDCICFISEKEVKGIAEITSVLLANEISLHYELHSPSTTSPIEIHNINRQLLGLFGASTNVSTVDASTNSIEDKGYLEQLISTDIWCRIQKPLSQALNAAKVDQEFIRNHSEQSNRLGGWTKASATLHKSRRSPFK